MIFMQLDDFFTFGKYKDHPLREVIEKEPSYIRWAIAKNIIDINQEAVDLLEMVCE